MNRFLLAIGALVLFATGVARPASAQIGSDRYASMVVDAQSGTIISAANADEYRYPASLTKMMTIYMLFEALRDHRVALSDALPVSAWASSMPPTKLGLLPGGYITVEQALLGLVTKSANDAAAALGEMLGGDEDRFAQMMTLRARALGMSRTTFRNASGLPDWGQVTTARDMVILARHLIQDFPAYYHYFSTPSFQFHGHTILSHQRMLQTYPGADGLKTGYIEASGYNVVTSAVRGDVRLIGVVFGASSGWERDTHLAVLLDQGFQRMGVPIEVARHEPVYRNPFIASASAATLARGSAVVQVAEARAVRARPGRYAPELRRASTRRQADPRALSVRPIGAREILDEDRSALARRTRFGYERQPSARASASAWRQTPTRTAHRSGAGGRYPG